MEQLFIEALRQKLTFNTQRGLVSTQDLWDMPLVGTFSLDATAQEVAEQIKAHGTKSFVTKNKKNLTLELKLDILKYIIEVKLYEREEAKQATANKERKEVLMDAIAEKEIDELKGRSLKDLQKEAKKL